MNVIMSKIHLDILDNIRQDIFNKLKAFAHEGYLAGGTALAFQLHHRISEDFDIFINRHINNNLRLKVKEVFGEVKFYTLVLFQTASTIGFNRFPTSCLNR